MKTIHLDEFVFIANEATQIYLKHRHLLSTYYRHNHFLAAIPLISQPFHPVHFA